MALLTGDSLKLLQNRIDDAKTSLKNQLAQYEKALAELATRELKGQKKTSLEPIIALLDNR